MMKPSVIVCLQLFAVLNHLAKEAQPADQREPIIETFLPSQLSSWGVGVKERSLLLKYVLAPKQVPNIKLSPSEDKLKASIQQAYEVFCEYFGPNEADNMLHKAITKVSKSSAGKRYHPKNFL